MGTLGNHLFTFAVLTDSHVNEGEDRSVSPFACNRLANARFRYAARCVDRHEPAFVVHLGDMANPLPELDVYGAAVRNFNAIAAELRSPLHLVAGNHCVGDKPGGWVPVPRVREESLAQYDREHGKHYYSFDHGPCHFAVLNSLIVNSDLDRERRQKRWLEEDLARAAEDGKRIWVMMHYPLYVAEKDELGSYDNVDQPGRSWLLNLFRRHRVEAAYSGHVHHYFYNRSAETHMYTLPATSFVRQDYSEMFGVAPDDDEGGRDDRPKLGYCLVKVYERGHVNHFARTHGKRLAENEELHLPDRIGAVSFREKELAPVGAEMRENWLSRTALKLNNSVSPFTRRRARNDWAVLALEEMGISKVRVALQEMVNRAVRQRMADLTAAGFEFTVYSHGIPGEGQYDLIREHRDLLAGWELVMSLGLIDSGRIESVAGDLARLALYLPSDEKLPCFLNEVRDPSRARIDDANVKHSANYGFQVDEREKIEKLLSSNPVAQAFSGFVFRLRRKGEPAVPPCPAIHEISRIGEDAGLRNQVHILFSGNLTSDRLDDNLDTANRIAESTVAAVAAGNVDVYFDTFEDVDRGYFVRTGLVDRRYNPRPAAKVLRHLNAALARYDVRGVQGCFTEDVPGGRLLRVPFAAGFLALVMPAPRLCLEQLDVSGGVGCESLDVLDLESGEVSSVAFEARGRRLHFEPLPVETPVLMIGTIRI